MKMRQPFTEPSVVGMYVLNVDGAAGTGAYPYAGTQVDRLVRHPMPLREAAVGGVRIGHQERLRRQLGQQMLDQLRRLQGAGPSDGIDGLSAQLARHQDAVELAPDAAYLGLAAQLGRLAIERARTLLRFEQEPLVSLDDPVQLRWPLVLDPVEQALPPAKRG